MNMHSFDSGEVEGQDAELLTLRNRLGKELQEFSRIDPAQACFAIVSTWLLIAALIATAILAESWWVYILVIPLIAGRMHALGVIGHDGAHYRLFNNHFLNEWVSDSLCMLPTGMSLRRWRYEHLLHHKYINTGKDPYLQDFKQFKSWHWPKSRLTAFKTMLRDLLGLAVPEMLAPASRMGPFGKNKLGRTPQEIIRIVGTYSIMLLIVTLTNGWFYFLTLWVLPLITPLFFFVRWRTVGEHLGMDGPEDINRTRHVDANWLERLTVAPYGINYHLAHHLFPSVPFYNLPNLHQRLLKEPVYREKAVIKRGYFGKNSIFSDVVQPF